MRSITVMLVLILIALTNAAGDAYAESPWGDAAWEELGPREATSDGVRAGESGPADDKAPRSEVRSDWEEDLPGGNDPDAQDLAPVPETETEAVDQPVDADEEADPRIADWRASLLYGIDDLVLEALSEMISNQQSGLGPETLEVLSATRNNEVRAQALQYLRTIEDAGAAAIALALLQNGPDGEVMRAAIHYLRDVEPNEPEHSAQRAQVMFELIPDSSLRTAQVAVRAIGGFGGTEEARLLAELFNELPSDSQQLQGEILLAIGDIASEDAVPFLIQVLQDPIYGSVLRRYAADGLGRTGDERALPALREAAESEDSSLKAYAVGGLARFEDAASVETLRRAMRDSNPLVRRFAIEGLGRNRETDAVPALIFQVRRDPDLQVRFAATGALAQIGNDEAVSFLHEQYRISATPVELRNRIAGTLIEHHFERSSDLFHEVMDEEWPRNDSRVLQHLARTLSETETDAAAEFYKRLLEHPSFVIQIYAVRGIHHNRLSAFRDALETRARDHNHPALRREAKAALADLGL